MMVGPKKQDFLAKDQHPQRRPFHSLNPMSVSLLKIGHDIRKQRGSKLEVRKNVFNGKWCPKLMFLNENKIKKDPLIFDIENQL